MLVPETVAFTVAVVDVAPAVVVVRQQQASHHRKHPHLAWLAGVGAVCSRLRSAAGLLIATACSCWATALIGCSCRTSASVAALARPAEHSIGPVNCCCASPSSCAVCAFWHGLGLTLGRAGGLHGALQQLANARTRSHMISNASLARTPSSMHVNRHASHEQSSR